jgi:chemotaxis protein methyltransferase CheR
MTQAISHTLLAQLSDVIAAQMGLHFPQARWHDLERGIQAAAREWMFPDAETCIQWLVASPLTRHQIALLATHLTVGETYFFREPQVFAMLEEHILPALVRARLRSARHLSIWSAGCATGEEPYSIAISINKVIPKVQDWHVTLLATDINPRVLQRASEGVYRAWSFRSTPQWIKERYFTRQPGDCLAILPAIQQMVQFAYLNLVDDMYPALLTNTTAVDVIFCRNVLMYLAPEQAKKVVHRLYCALAEGGWLIVSPSETSQALFAQFQAVNIPGAILYRRGQSGELRVASGGAPASSRNAVQSQVPRQNPPLATHDSPLATRNSPPSEPTAYRDALALYQHGRYAEVVDTLRAWCAHEHADAQAMALLARAYANQSQLAEARQWCEKALAADKLNAGIHYLHALILQEQGVLDNAVLALKRVLYLDQSFVLAHLALGTLAQQQGKRQEADKHFEDVLALLSAYRQEDILPESEGVTAGRLREITASMYHRPAAC